ncbi:hypothetical protein M9H77_30253 [Catharanthus roseus]|uniref:Uncharacterized protein n=1 Tax=Catharanthus roseus TaxID=4058 RepID=A0ACB9ZX39_CATRO|nr:hypothetical protein M9H77_30253 [Catharanthus roseus]
MKHTLRIKCGVENHEGPGQGQQKVKFMEPSIIEASPKIQARMNEESLPDSLMHSGVKFDPSCYGFGMLDDTSLVDPNIVGFELDCALFVILHDEKSLQDFQDILNSSEAQQNQTISSPPSWIMEEARKSKEQRLLVMVGSHLTIPGSSQDKLEV